ncbi:hypothetical protein HPB50_020391 [Hyalomma asiaticum]|uniref:Uncharacterized protein n=1 Tax=Hyalomma asiaticum TaxID=266040 RepID=A0ACB7RK03_HYAAI|nr:hypothetical protein HPB50_020391 [Hyalomma asiaticum]
MQDDQGGADDQPELCRSRKDVSQARNAEELAAGYGRRVGHAVASARSCSTPSNVDFDTDDDSERDRDDDGGGG